MLNIASFGFLWLSFAFEFARSPWKTCASHIAGPSQCIHGLIEVWLSQMKRWMSLFWPPEPKCLPSRRNIKWWARNHFSRSCFTRVWSETFFGADLRLVVVAGCSLRWASSRGAVLWWRPSWTSAKALPCLTRCRTTHLYAAPHSVPTVPWGSSAEQKTKLAE